jgi:predicted ATPase/transcriptional regulator with XRE-family HTH domain
VNGSRKGLMMKWAVDSEQSFGSLLKRYRRAAHLTQEELAERAGYSSDYVSMLERGVRIPQPLTVTVLADALKLAEVDRQALDAAATPRPHAAGAAQSLPPPPEPLLGRERDVAHVVRLLCGDDNDRGAVRLLTLTGPGGVGKTSLARQVGSNLAGEFPDGAAFVDLAAVSAPDDVFPTIARALAVRDIGGAPIRDQLIACLRDRESLLFLDSFERVIEAATMVADLLTSCPHLTLMITSRVPLRLQAEHEFRVQPLTLPESGDAHSLADLLGSPAVSLFILRARRVKPALALDDARVALIADICRRLDGLPLAIELAAARVSHMPLLALHSRMRRRLEVLTGGARDLPIRQQRMRDTISWSYDLLTNEDQVLLRRLSVFVGGWTLEAAQEVAMFAEREPEIARAEDALDGLRNLVESSLVIPVDDDGAEEPRYRMLETIREYAADQLLAAGELDVVRRRHGVHYALLAERAEPALQDQGQHAWYPRLEWEHDNLRTAADWLLEAGEVEMALRLGSALWRFWQRHGDIREGRRRLEAALVAADTAQAEGREVLEPVRAKALWGASWLAYHQGDYTRTRSLSAEHLALARKHNDSLGIRNALTGLGMADLAEGNADEAARSLQEALDVCTPLGDTWHYATSVLNLGNATMVAGDLSRAAALYEEALTLYQGRGDAVFIARTQQHLGYIALLRGEYAHAATLFAQSLQAFYGLGEQPGIADGLEATAAVYAAMGDARRAARLLGAASALRERTGLLPLAYLRWYWQPIMTRVEALFGKVEWAAAQEEGRALTLAEAVVSAVNESGSDFQR